MAILPFRSARGDTRPLRPGTIAAGYSIEVMPRTAAKVDDFRAILPAGTRVYIAHLEGTPFEDMLDCAKRLSADGFAVMPHVPARIIPNRAMLDLWLKRYAAEAGVAQALVLAGGPKKPVGEFDSSMQLLETGLFDRHGFSRLHVAGHPEGNRDIDPDGSTRLVDEAARWKQDFSERTGAEMAMATQFAFDAAPVLAWADRLADAGIDLPIYVGVAGPAKLQTLIKFSIACGVGPSLSVLQKRARDLSKLLLPFTPDKVLSDLAAGLAAGGGRNIAGIHVFPLGGIAVAANYANALNGAAVAQGGVA
jgi:methylenetetrahydrofolate reductase (NADPH)